MPTLLANGIEHFYESSGPANAPVVVFAHSVGCSLEIWEAQVAALGDRYRCIRYDIRGHGRSAAVDIPTTIDDLAADLGGLLDALEIERAHIAGLSIGGMLGQAFAVAHPERVKSLMLVSTTALLPTLEFWATRAATVRADGMASVFDAVIPRWFTPDFIDREPAIIDGFRQRFAATDVAGYARCCEAIGGMDLRERIGAIAAPTLIVVGADDPATPPAMSEDLRQRIPHAEMVVIPDASHIVSVESPDAVTAQLAAFLARHEPDAPNSAFVRGLATRREVLGDAYVERSLARAGAFAMPWQDFITRHAWNDVWGDPTLPRKTRSLLTLAMMVALHREEEFKIHLKPALGNGVSLEELRAMILQTGIYAGIPAGNAAIRWVREELGDEIAAFEARSD
ncbi:3-oxoadipate enol-lactonase [Bauldia litoralis]|uniref:bifunctional 3-oxoadipate enol-lactonase/4-carboxymuconolactone decarboxylase PcaDC n=1 Tax=Bauldia litoralis TaxID=665467 RepID=UPI0032674E82